MEACERRLAGVAACERGARGAGTVCNDRRTGVIPPAPAWRHRIEPDVGGPAVVRGVCNDLPGPAIPTPTDGDGWPWSCDRQGV
ncbi:hypothetical protein GCM10009848_22510 [Micromonospora lupini]